MDKKIQAKHIDDQVALDAVKQLSMEPLGLGGAWGRGSLPRWVNRWEFAERLGVPEKVALAKARALIRRGLMEGCACGCRGDFRSEE